MNITCEKLTGMNISKYTFFKEDVLKCMSTLIHTYNLKSYVLPGYSFDLMVCLSNENCKIIINAISPYPNVGVDYDVYYKRNNDFNNIYKFKLFSNYGIDENEYNDYLIELNNIISDPDEYPFAGYRRALIINERIILKYYMPIVFPNK